MTSTANDQLSELKRRLGEADDLGSAASLLSWDQSTFMPPGGAPARGRQLSTLGRLAHEKATAPEVGRLLEGLEGLEAERPPEDPDAALVRVARRDFERASRLPSPFVAELYAHSAAAYDAWTRARPENDFAAMAPLLEKTVELSRRVSSYFPGAAHVADPLIEMADHGMTVSALRPLFGELRAGLVPLVAAVAGRPAPDTAMLHRHYPEADQLAFGLEVAQSLGYDLTRGRQDKTHHPFMTKFSLGDVRITTRVKEDDLSEALFSTIHEAGHAMYEQGIDPAFENTPLASGTSAGVHESQSRLWENVVGRSQGFWTFFYPRLQARFPEQLSDVALSEFYQAVNRVQRSLIRTDADELTYNLHVILRFDLELELLEGTLSVRDLPEAWRERYRADLGVASPDDRDGVLQDVHWFAGLVGGAFQGYTLGNVLSAQFFESAVLARPGIPAEVERGEFATLHGWLREHVYRPGRTFTAPELVERATGRPLETGPYLRYLGEKYGELYGFGQGGLV